MALQIDRTKALDLWRGVMVRSVQSVEPDLTARQLAVLMTVYLSPPPHTVRGLAETLGVGKPAITRALDTLSRLNLVRRRRDEEDGRNVLVQRTHAGQTFLARFGDLIAERAATLLQEPATRLPARGAGASVPER